MILVDNITYAVGNFTLYASLEVNADDYLVLAGKTGCGKSTLLECICGLRQPVSGRIVINGQDVTNLDPRHRKIGYVPQDQALFDHLSVADNILFSQRVRRVSKQRQHVALHDLAERLGIGHLLQRSIHGLSGGERQRVALARALAAEPSVLLLDEPVSALDEATRDQVCQELFRVFKELQIPVIHVCHSSEEARLVATRMAVMGNGCILQVNTLKNLYEYPTSLFVARFIRLPNLLSGQVRQKNGTTFIHCNGIDLRASASQGTVDFMIRPWQIQINPDTTMDNMVAGVVSRVSCSGAVVQVEVANPIPLVIELARNCSQIPQVGEHTRLGFPATAIHIIQ